MIDHDAARRTGATAIDFELEPAERADSMAICARVPPAARSWPTGHRCDQAEQPRPGSGTRRGPGGHRDRRRAPRCGGRSTPVLLAAAAILVLAAVGGAAIGVGALPRPAGPEAAAAAPVGRAVHWSTDVVDLAADDLWLEVGGQVVVPPDDREIKISSDAGTPQKWTLEVAWNAGRTEMRIEPVLRRRRRRLAGRRGAHYDGGSRVTGWRPARSRSGRQPAPRSVATSTSRSRTAAARTPARVAWSCAGCGSRRAAAASPRCLEARSPH